MFMFYFSSDFKEPALKNFIINGVYMISTEPDRYSDINVDIELKALTSSRYIKESSNDTSYNFMDF